MSAVGVGDLFFGVAQVDPLGAGFAGDDEWSGGFFPLVGFACVAAEFDLFGEGDFICGGLGAGGYGGEDSEADHGWKDK